MTRSIVKGGRIIDEPKRKRNPYSGRLVAPRRRLHANVLRAER